MRHDRQGPPSVSDLLAPMAECEADLDGTRFRVDRARVLAGMAAVRRPAPQRRTGTLALVAAGVAAFAVGGWLWQRSATRAFPPFEVTVVSGSATQIAAKSELVTAAHSQARVRTPEGLQIDLRARTRVALGDLERRASQVKLLEGSILCSVPRRPASRPFQVVSGDVTVVDLGTVFTVSLEGDTHETRILVEEGEVLVQRGAASTRVHAPDSWSSAEDAKVAVAPSAKVPVAAPMEIPSPPAPVALPRAPIIPARTPASRAAALPTPTPPATLEREARLLRRGLAAERQGRSAEAVTALSQLLQKYPRSQLAPDARAALERVETRARR